jgi:hypothetical protein
VPGGKAALQAVLSRLGAQQTPEAWKSFAEWMRANGLLKAEPNASAALTNKYLPGQAP